MPLECNQFIAPRNNSLEFNIPHISVCICTYKRAGMLARLLQELQAQDTEDKFSYSAVVIDNDSNRSASQVVSDMHTRVSYGIRYEVEPVQNIALARNKAIASSRGAYIAYIDDDEFPSRQWLLRLYDTMIEYSADAVLGPVIPYFASSPPKWIQKSKIMDRESFETGTTLQNPRYTRTGNTLISLSSVKRMSIGFDPKYGRTGGEDVDFFEKFIGAGGQVIWCNEAIVHEEIREERYTRMYHIRRALLRGAVASQRYQISFSEVIKSIVAIGGYTLMLPFLMVIWNSRLMKYLIKDCDHLGKLLGYLNIYLIKERKG